MEQDRNDLNGLSYTDGRTETANETALEITVPSELAMPTKKVPGHLNKKGHEEEEEISEMDSEEYPTLDHPPGETRTKKDHAKKVVLEKVEEVCGDKSSAEWKTMESFLSLMEKMMARTSLTESISRLAKHDSLSDEKTEKFMFMSAFLDCPRSYLLVHVTTDTDGKEARELITDDNCKDIEQKLGQGHMELQIRSSDNDSQQAKDIKHVTTIRLGFRRAIYCLVMHVVGEAEACEREELKDRATELFQLNHTLRLSSELSGYDAIAMFASYFFRKNPKAKVGPMSMFNDKRASYLASPTEDDFWSSENCWERLYNRVRLTKALLEGARQGELTFTTLNRTSIEKYLTEVEQQPEPDQIDFLNLCTADLERSVMFGSAPSGEGEDSFCSYLRQQFNGMKYLDTNFGITETIFTACVELGICTDDEANEWREEIDTYDGHPTVKITPVSIPRQVGEDFSPLGLAFNRDPNEEKTEKGNDEEMDGDKEALASDGEAKVDQDFLTNSYVIVLENVYSRGMQILKSRWVNGGGRQYVRRLKGMRRHGGDEFSNSFLRSAVKEGYHLPYKVSDGTPQTPDVLLGRGQTSTRYHSTHYTDLLDHLDFSSAQFIRKQEKDFLMERVILLEDVPGSRVQRYKERFGREKMFPVFMGATLSPFTDPDEGVKYETFGEPSAQYFGDHSDANEAVTRATTKKVALTGKCMPTKYDMKTITMVSSNCLVPPANLVHLRTGLADVETLVGTNAIHLQGQFLQAVATHRVTTSPAYNDLLKSLNGGHALLVDKDMVPIPCDEYISQKVVRHSTSIRSSRPVDHPKYEAGYPANSRRVYDFDYPYTSVPYTVCQDPGAWSHLPLLKSDWSTDPNFGIRRGTVKDEKSVEGSAAESAGMGEGNPYVNNDVVVEKDGGVGKRASTEASVGRLFKKYFGKNYGSGAQYKSMGVKEVEQSVGYKYLGQTVSVQSSLCESMAKGAALQELILRGCIPFTADQKGIEYPRCHVLQGSTIPTPGGSYREDAVRQGMGLEQKKRATRNAIVSDYSMIVSQSYRGILTRVVDPADPVDPEAEVVYQDRLYKLYHERNGFLERMKSLFQTQNATTTKDRFRLVMANIHDYPWAYNLQISAAGGGDKILGQHPENSKSLETMAQAQRSVAPSADMTRGDNRVVNELCVDGTAVQLYLNVTQYESTLSHPGEFDVKFKKGEILKFDRRSFREAISETASDGTEPDTAAGGSSAAARKSARSKGQVEQSSSQVSDTGGESLGSSTHSAHECVVGCLGLFEVLEQKTTRDMDVGMFLAHRKRLPVKSHDFLTWIYNGHSYFKLREVYNPVLVAVVIATGGKLEKFYVPDSPYLKLCESQICEGDTLHDKNRLLLEADISRQFVRHACGAGLQKVTADAEFLTMEGKSPVEEDETVEELNEEVNDDSELKVRYGVPMWDNSLWSKMGMEVNTLVTGNGFMTGCFSREQQETNYFRSIMQGTLPDDEDSSFHLAGGKMSISYLQCMLFLVQMTMTSVGRYLKKSLYTGGNSKEVVGQCFAQNNRPLPIATRIYPVSSPTEVYDPTTMLLVHKLRRFPPSQGFKRSSLNPMGQEDWSGRLVLDFSNAQEKFQSYEMIRYFTGLAFLCRVVSNVAVFEEYTIFMAERDQTLREADSNGRLIVELPRMNELITGNTFFDFLEACFGQDSDKFYSKAGGYQFDGEMPAALKTVRGFRRLFYHVVGHVMTDGWIEEHRYKGSPMVINNIVEGATSAAAKRQLKTTQQKVLEDMALCFNKALVSLGEGAKLAGSSTKEKANGMFLLQKIMEDIRKVVEEPFGFVHPLCSSLTKDFIYAGSGGANGAGLLVAAVEEQSSNPEPTLEEPNEERTKRKSKSRSAQKKQRKKGPAKKKRRSESGPQRYRRFYESICDSPQEILTAMLLDKYFYGGTQRGRDEVLFSAAQHFPLSVFTLEHIFCKFWLLTFHANHHVFGKKHPTFDKKYTFPVRSVETNGTVYPWDDPMDLCSARMKKCAEWCMHQFDCLCEHKSNYVNEKFDLTDQKSFFSGSLMLKESVPAFDVPADEPRVMLLGNTWERVNKPATNTIGPAQEKEDEVMTPATINPGVGNAETRTTSDMEVDVEEDEDEDETSGLVEPFINATPAIVSQSQSSQSPRVKRKRDGADGDGGSQDESTDSGGYE